jgi:dienelactone hydrolase
VADIVLFHHAQGLTPGVQAFADRLRAAGHLVIVPDYYGGRTFDTIEAGVAYAEAQGFPTLIDRAVAAAQPLPSPVVVAGFSLGTLPAQKLAQSHRGVIAAILYHGGVPPDVFESPWPSEVALQVHVVEDDAWNDIEETEQLIEASGGQLLVYPGTGHLVADSGHPDYDPEVADEIVTQSLAFLEAVDRLSRG